MKRTASHALFAPLFLACLYVLGCERYLGGIGSSGDEPLTGVLWNLEAIEDADGDVTFRPDPEETYQVMFNVDGSLTARNACNRCTGRYETDESSLSIEAACEESGCGTPSPYLGYGDALNRATAYEIGGRTLRARFVDRAGIERVLVHVSGNSERHTTQLP